MLKPTKVLLVLTLTATVCVARSFGQSLHIQVDEYGHLLINGAPGAPGVVGPEPLSGLPTLFFPGNPFFGNFGDIVLREPPATNISDILRFSTDGFLYFFSDQSSTNQPPEPGVLADGPFPQLIPGPLFFTETGPEGGPNGLFGYTAFPLDVGGNPAFPGGITYDFLSDGVIPEPSALMLSTVGGLLWTLRLRRQVRGRGGRRGGESGAGRILVGGFMSDS